MRGRCKLCHRHVELRRSHIISKFALRDAQGDDTRALLRVSNAEMPRLPRDQSWDQEYLLCGDCEERRRRWEAIVAATVAGQGDGRELRPVLYVDEEHPGHMVRAEQVPYGPVKLWVLSTFYLMHHAAKSDWARVSLTVDEADRLRRQLHSGHPGSDLDFQVFGRITTRSSITAKDRGAIIVPGYINEWRIGRTRTRAVRLHGHWHFILRLALH